MDESLLQIVAFCTLSHSVDQQLEQNAHATQMSGGVLEEFNKFGQWKNNVSIETADVIREAKGMKRSLCPAVCTTCFWQNQD